MWFAEPVDDKSVVWALAEFMSLTKLYLTKSQWLNYVVLILLVALSITLWNASIRLHCGLAVTEAGIQCQGAHPRPHSRKFTEVVNGWDFVIRPLNQ